jgi:RNA polymerase sigma-70 factor (ECF subfamily)
VIRNLALTRRRKKTPASAADDALLLAAAAEPDHAGSTRADLAAVLATLPDAQREVLLMRFVDGMALAEIAEALQIPVGTVKSRVHHALRTLRDDERTKRYFAP